MWGTSSPSAFDGMCGAFLFRLFIRVFMLILSVRSDELAPEAARAMNETGRRLRESQLQGALESVWALVTRANQYVDQTAPFKLAKDPTQAARLDEVLFNLAEVCRVLAVLLWPFIPDACERIYAQLGVTTRLDQFDQAAWGGLVPGHTIGDPSPLFPRKDLPARS